MKREVKKLGSKFSEMMAAVTFAEEGDAETARELIRARRNVLLVLTGNETDTRSLRHAVSIAQRTGADLEVLAADVPETAAALKRCAELTGAESIGFQVFRKKGCMRDATVKHAAKRSDLVCVVIESTDALEVDCSPKSGRKLAGAWKQLGCPLTLVAEKTE